MPIKTRTHLLFGVILLIFLVIGSLYAILTPPWQAPDEPAHYNYIAQIAGGGCCPVMEMGDWDSSELESLKGAQFPEDAALTEIEYEDHQPPLYYLIGSLVYTYSNGSLTALRIYSLILGAGVVITTYLLAGRILPERPQAALAAALFTAFIPQNIAITASVNNDSMANLLVGVLLLVISGYFGNPVKFQREGILLDLDESSRPHAGALGLLLGLGLMIKLSTYSFAAVVFVAILLRAYHEKHSWKWVLGQVLWVGGIALLIGGWWWVRNLRVYGWPDFLAQIIHERVVVGQLRTADLINEIGLLPYAKTFISTTFHSFWGQFGWMAVPMPASIYAALGAFTVMTSFGAALFFIGQGKQKELAQAQKSAFWVLATTLVMVFLQFAVYNVRYVQFQGRYLFTGLLPMAVLTVLGGLGLVEAVRPLVSKDKLLEWLPVFLLIWMPLLSIYALFVYLLPNLG